MPSLELQNRRSALTPPFESSLRQSDNEDIHDPAIVEQNLAPADGGLTAWRLVAVAFVFEALLWGPSIPYRIIVFPEYPN